MEATVTQAVRFQVSRASGHHGFTHGPVAMETASDFQSPPGNKVCFTPVASPVASLAVEVSGRCCVMAEALQL